MQFCYEIFLSSGALDSSKWQSLLDEVAKYLGTPASWSITLTRRRNTIYYHLRTDKQLPTSLGLTDFMFKPSSLQLEEDPSFYRFPYRNNQSTNFLALSRKLQKNNLQLQSATIHFRSCCKILGGHIQITYSDTQKIYSRRLLLFLPIAFLNNDFGSDQAFLFRKTPNYLKMDKVINLLTEKSESALFEIDAFPYLNAPTFLQHSAYDFAKHSLILGASGSRKSHFIASLLDKIWSQNRQEYQVVVIDPHDALFSECRNIDSRSVVDFRAASSCMDLFGNHASDIEAQIELTLSLFRGLIDGYNGRLERVLRYSTYLLVATEKFSFTHLRKLLLDLEFRNQLVQNHHQNIPPSVSHFFLAEFNELKTQNYNDAIAPIIAFIDEMQMVPVFNSSAPYPDLFDGIKRSFLTIFSLNRLHLGEKVTRTIAGLLLQQIFLIAEGRRLERKLIVIIDEVAVVENPIIPRFLSELRKYNVTTILAGQYLNQVSESLRQAIFANVTNYYLFRVARDDSETLARNLKIHLATEDTPEKRQNILTDLKNRECIVQIGKNDEIFPAFKARTATYLTSLSENAKSQSQNSSTDLLTQPFEFLPTSRKAAIPVKPQTVITYNFDIGCSHNSTDVIKLCTTSRKNLRSKK